jgi:hypothetical protein
MRSNDRRKDMPNYHPVQIRFIRRGANGQAERNANRDDVMTISRVSENYLRLTYTEKGDDGAVVDIMNYTCQQSVSYMYRVLWLLGLDDDPFQSVQFFLPGYPTCLILVKDVKPLIPQLLELLFSVFHAWPAVGVDRSGNERTSRHVLFDQPGVRILRVDETP